MIIRREFLQLGLASGAAALLPLPVGADSVPAAATTMTAAPLFRLLHDSRAPQSLQLAAQLGARLLGDTAQMQQLQVAVQGDITRFWYQDLQPQWQRAPLALAGCTGTDVLFCLEQLARDSRLRVQWRASLPGAIAGSTADLPLVSWLIAAA